MWSVALAQVAADADLPDDEIMSLPIQTRTSSLTSRERLWVTTLIGAILVFTAIYLLFVRTAWGQTVENAALIGAGLAPGNSVQVDNSSLAVISRTSLGVAVLGLGALGWWRAGWRLGVGAAAVVAGSTLIAEGLKRFLLSRPELVDAPPNLLHNSFPSGHTTIAMSLLLATLLVIPLRWRGIAMFLTLTWATGIGALTVAARWHRLSDTLGGDLVALSVALVALIWLSRRGLVRPAPRRHYPLRGLYLAAIVLLGVGALGIGLGLLILNGQVNQPGTEVFAVNSYYASHALALAGSVFTALGFWACLRQLETTPTRPKSG